MSDSSGQSLEIPGHPEPSCEEKLSEAEKRTQDLEVKLARQKQLTDEADDARMEQNVDWMAMVIDNVIRITRTERMAADPDQTRARLAASRQRREELRALVHRSADSANKFTLQARLLETALAERGADINQPRNLNPNPAAAQAGIVGVRDFNPGVIRQLAARVAELEEPAPRNRNVDPETSADRLHVTQYTVQANAAASRVLLLERELTAIQERERLLNQRETKLESNVARWSTTALGGPNAAQEQRTLLQNINGQANEVIESLNLMLDNADAGLARRDRRIARRDRNIESLRQQLAQSNNTIVALRDKNKALRNSNALEAEIEQLRARLAELMNPRGQKRRNSNDSENPGSGKKFRNQDPPAGADGDNMSLA